MENDAGFLPWYYDISLKLMYFSKKLMYLKTNIEKNQWVHDS